MNAEKLNTINEALSQEIDPALVSKRKLFQGRNEEVSYIAGHHAIEQANRIFGPLGWSYTVPDQHIENVSRMNNSTGEIIRVDRVCFATVQVVIIDGPTREDTGSCGVGKEPRGARDTGRPRNGPERCCYGRPEACLANFRPAVWQRPIRRHPYPSAAC